MSFPKFKIRASQAQRIMAKGRGSDISAGAKTYVREWLLDLMYGGVRVSKVDTKYTLKGEQVEDFNIDYYGENKGILLKKNELSFANEYATGTPDVLLDNLVIDIKSSWDYTTFPMFFDKIPNNDYASQLQVYMWLTEIKDARLVYVLSNTPENLRRSDLDWLDYTELPSDFRIKEFDLEYDDLFIEQLIEKVEKCQDYLNALIRQMNWERFFEG